MVLVIPVSLYINEGSSLVPELSNGFIKSPHKANQEANEFVALGAVSSLYPLPRLVIK
jgi:hypothetical protein